MIPRTLRAALAAAAFLASVASSPASAFASTVQWLGQNLAYTVDAPSVSTAQGVSLLNTAATQMSASGAPVPWEGLGNPTAGTVSTYNLKTPTGGTQAPSAGYYINNPGASPEWTPSPGLHTLTINLPETYSYFGTLVNTFNTGATTISFYNGNDLLGTINLTGVGAQQAIQGTFATAADGRAFYLNTSFINGTGFNKITITEDGDSIWTSQPVVSKSPVSLTNMSSTDAPVYAAVPPSSGSASPAPLPALAGTLPGLLAGLGFLGVRRRRKG